MWKLISEVSPPLNVLIQTKIDDSQGIRNIQAMKFDGKLWWADSMYVYYTPTHWK